MNLLAIDFGTKRIGLAVSINGFISTLPVIRNDEKTFGKIRQIIDEYRINKIYIGLSDGKIAKLTKLFVTNLSTMLKLPIETVEEHVSTIEADEIFAENRGKKKDYKTTIDSLAAAVILRRIIG